MTKQEFGTETQRWYAGSGRADDLTPERLAALWDRFGHLSLNVWRNTVSTALLEPRWPTPERLDMLVGKHEDEEGKRIARQRNEQAKRSGSGLVGIASGIRSTSGFAKLCQRMLVATLEQKLTPAQAADFLSLELDERQCAHGVDCAGWVEALRAAGADWERVPMRGLLRAEGSRSLDLGQL